MNSCLSRLCTVTLFAVLFVSVTAVAQENTDTRAVKDDSYNKDEVLEKARGFFGSTTKGLAEGIEKVSTTSGGQTHISRAKNLAAPL